MIWPWELWARSFDSGRWGEGVAVRMLRRNGLRIIGRRVRIGRRDEVDIVAREGDVLVFVEVKTRASERFGRPADAVDAKKRRVLSRAAVRYLGHIRFEPVYFRFDLVEVVGSPREGVSSVRHIREAFPLDSRYTLPF
jgi:putative endonuclease